MKKKLDWPRIAHLLKIGIAAALMVLVGDMLLGGAYMTRQRAAWRDSSPPI